LIELGFNGIFSKVRIYTAFNNVKGEGTKNEEAANLAFVMQHLKSIRTSSVRSILYLAEKI